jgi:hypothetical protein
VPKVQHKPIKTSELGFKRKEQKKPKAALVWCTGLSGVPPDSVWCTRVDQLELATFGFLEKSLRYNSSDCLVCQAEQRSPAQRSSSTVGWHSVQCVYSQSSARRRTRQWKVTVRCTTGLSGGPGCQSSNGRTITVGWRGWRTGLSGAPIDSSPTPPVGLVVGAINTPNHHHFKASKFSAIYIQYKSSRLHSNTQTRDQILSQV